MVYFICFICLFIGYLIGSVNTSIVVSRLIYNKDIREYGSKSAGLTNTFRVFGKWAALLVLTGDILKGILAYFIGKLICFIFYNNFIDYSVIGLLSGVGAVMGHNWPLYFNFKGGKGALIAFIVMLMTDWRMTSITIIFFIFLVMFTKYVSLGTICSTILFIILSYLPYFEKDIYFHIISCFLAIIIIIKHRTNMQRLFSGNENKIIFSKHKDYE